MIINKKYGFTPYTGRKELKIKNKKFIEYTSENLDSIVFSTELENIISWFDSRSEIKKYIQKNVRGYLGEKNKSVNKKIQESYKYDPTYFWFKHNGIIFFVDHYTLSDNEEKIILNNPQIVNGAQTINAIFGVFDERKNAEVLIRVVKLPYDRKKSYETGLKIIEALNSQTEVKPSDLRSNDEQQVKLENLVSNMNNNYRYFRKRELSHQNTI
jgi:bifunctional DNA-binding transcriptional regulator/antitoxin component of YhaV-PrlF toxin-antitoxin module